MREKGRDVLLKQLTTAANCTVEWDAAAANGMYLQIDHGSVTGAFLFLQRTGASRDDDTFNWCTVPEQPITAPAGVSANHPYPISDCRAPYYRLEYAHSAGTGSLVIGLFVKGN